MIKHNIEDQALRKAVDILLVFPPLRTWDRPRNFPCGLGLIASILRRAGYTVAVIDVNGLRWDNQQVIDEIKKYDTKIKETCRKLADQTIEAWKLFKEKVENSED